MSVTPLEKGQRSSRGCRFARQPLLFAIYAFDTLRLMAHKMPLMEAMLML